MMKLKLIIPGLIIAATIVSCNQTSDKSKSGSTDSSSTVSAAPADLKDNNTQAVYDKYLKLKDVLVSSDSAAAQLAGKDLASALSKIDGCENTSTLATKISTSKNLTEQRVHFTALSSDIVALMKHADVNKGSVYVQFCPMANEGNGGYWLSAEKEVMNPYYGSEMLNCGEVKEVISAK